MQGIVIIPTYNECENIGHIVPQILAHDLHVLIVDDHSPDGTGEIADALAAADQRVNVLHRAGKQGLGQAYVAGFRQALAMDAPYIFEMDADFSHDPRYLPELLAAARTAYDLVIGSRYVPGGGTENWGIDRKILSGGANFMVRKMLNLKVRDCTGGFRCWKRELIEKAGVLDLKIEGYAFLFITMDRCTRMGAKVGEVPIIFVDRQFGKSKMSRRIIFEAMRVLLKLWLARLSKK